MQFRTLGRTGLKASEIGFGTWGMGGGSEWRGGDDAESRKALRRAFELGINFYDTALAYGAGHSETLLGEFAREVGRDEILVASKIPPKNREWPARCGVKIYETFPRDYIRTSTEATLKNLRTDYIDVHQLHVWQDHWLEEPGWMEELCQLKKEGKIRFIGVSVNDHDPESAILVAQHKLADLVQVIYNIFDPTAENALFPLCKEYNIGVIARCPFDEGGLTGKVRPGVAFPNGDWRNDYFSGDRPKQVDEHVQRLLPLVGECAKSLPEMALRFCLSTPVVSTVIPGMRKVTHVESNVTASDGTLLPAALLAELKTHAWPRNFYL